MKEVFVILAEDRETGFRSLSLHWFNSLESTQRYIVKMFGATAVTDIVYKNEHSIYYIKKLSKEY